MPGMMPHMPEVVSYDVYEAMRDDGLPPTSVHEAKPYTVRLRKVSGASREEYADDMLALILKIKHLGRYSIIGAKIRTHRGILEYEFGLSDGGIIFNHEPMPDDLDFIPYESEGGYFVGEIGGSGEKDMLADISERIHTAEQLVALSR